MYLWPFRMNGVKCPPCLAPLIASAMKGHSVSFWNTHYSHFGTLALFDPAAVCVLYVSTLIPWADEKLKWM